MSTLAKAEHDYDNEFLRDLLTEPAKKGIVHSIGEALNLVDKVEYEAVPASALDKRTRFSGEPDRGPVEPEEDDDASAFLADLLTEPAKKGIVRSIGETLNLIDKVEYEPDPNWRYDDPRNATFSPDPDDERDPVPSPSPDGPLDQDAASPSEKSEPSLAGDLGRQVLGGAYKGVGSTIRGLGHVPTIIGDFVTTPLINKIFGTDYTTPNMLEGAADAVKGYGERLQEGVSEATREAIESSTPDGDITDPSTWTLGENPSVLGYTALGMDVFGQLLPVVAASMASGGASNAARIAAAGGTGAMMGGGAALDDVNELIDELDQSYSGEDAETVAKGGAGRSDLEKQSGYYRELLNRGYSKDEALARTKKAGGHVAFVFTAPISSVGGAITGKLMNPAEKLLNTKSIAARVAGRGGLSGLEEGVEETMETVQTRRGMNVGTGTNLNVTEGTFGDAVLGAIGGTGPGIIGGSLSRREARPGTSSAADVDSMPTYPGPPPPGKRWVTHGEPDSGEFLSYLEDDPEHVEQKSPEASAAPSEQTGAGGEAFIEEGRDMPQAPAALPVAVPSAREDDASGDKISDDLQPKRADPANAVLDIDREIAQTEERLAEISIEAGFGPMFDDERAELVAKIQALRAERATIAQVWPQMQQGAQTRFATEGGDHLDAHYALVEADDLAASHDVNLRINPSYPAEMQPRDRTRAASEMQVSGIAQRLDPMRLGASADAGSGSPIVGADGAVESGNGRTIALKRIYQANGQKAQDYRDYLSENAGQFGLTAQQVQGMKNPVLVRVRATPVDRAEFARLANAPTVAPMSDQEQAAADVDRITDMSDLVFDDSGEFNNAASREFIRRFISTLPPNEQGLMYDSDGILSARGYARVRNAILAKAYGDSPVLKRMTESLDDNIRNISKALLYVAPKVALVRSRIADGSLHDLDATPDIVTAAGELSRLKDAGTSIDDALSQMTMFGDGYSEVTRDLLRFLADNNRSPRRIANMLDSYLNSLIKAGNPNQGALLDDAEPPTKETLVKAAIESARKPNEQTDDRQQTIFGGDTAPGAEDGIKPDDARSDSAGAERAEGAGRTGAAEEVRQFDSLGKAEAHIKKNKMGATHGVFSAGKNRYEVRPKKGTSEVTQTQPSPKADAKPNPKKAAKTSPAPKAAPKAKPKAKSKAGEKSPQAPQASPVSTSSDAQPAQSSAKKESRAGQEPTAEKIEDFGEKIKGARKDYAQSYSEQMHAAVELDIAAQPLSKSWPASDYAKLLAAGMDPRAVGFMRAARDAVPHKPRMRNKLIAWAERVKVLRDFAQAVMQDPALVETILSQAPPLLQETVLFQAQMYVELGHEKSLAGLRLTSNRFNIYEGVKYDPPRTIWAVQKAVKASDMSNWPQIIASGDTREKAIAAFKMSYGELGSAKQERSATSFDIYSYRGKPGYIVGKKVGKNRIDLKYFDDVKSARAYLANNHDELVALLEKAKFIPSERRDNNNVRVGIDHRDGVDVTPEMFSDTFGFRGVQFGNYVEGQRRQADLNEAYDALLDMAGVLNVPPRALSLAGQLGLAFGARGKGGANAAKAHYERGHVVINLTKKKGAGSLAHEWWHALDSYFARKGGRPDEMITDGAQVATDSVRRQTMQAYATVVRAVMNNGMLERSRNLDKRRSSSYWSTTPEMTARAFESYIINRLQDQGQANDYLANIVSEAEFNLENAYPYPTAGEVKAVRAAFDEFFRTVETREDGDVVAFESVSADPAPTGMTVGAVQSLIAKVTAKLPESSNLQIRAVRSRLDVQDAEGRLPSFGAEAIYFPAEMVGSKLMPARVYLIANRISSARRAQQVLAHEFVGHFGMEALLGKDFAAVLADVARVTRVADGVSVTHQRPGDEHYATMDAVAHDYPGYSQAERAREVLARMAETGEHPSLLDRVYAAIRRFLRQLGLSIAYSKSELKAMIAEAAERLRDVSVERSVEQSMDASDSLRAVKARASDALESRDQSQSAEAAELAWLNREAVTRGMKDFRDLEARNTELARKLRQAWKNRESTRQAEIAKRANEIINDKVRTFKPLSAMTGAATRMFGVRWATSAAYTAAGRALMKSRESTWAGRTFETIKSGIVSDYGLPESVVDQRALLQGRQRVQLRKAGNLIEKLATLTRAESRVAYNWMNEKDHAKADALMKDLPEDSVFILGEIRDMIDQLSRQAVRLGQLTPEAYERNKFAYLRRSYEKHTLSQDKGQRARRSRTIAILGEQYKGRGLTVETTMKAVMEGNNAWWMRKLKEGKADDSFIGKKLVRLERRVNTGEDTVPIEGIGDRTRGRIRQVVYYPADEALPAKYEDWTREGVWEVRTTKGNKLVLWRDFTKEERVKMGEIDEARFAIAKTLHAMIHDVEVGHYLKWIAEHHAVKPGDEVPGTIVPAGTGRYTSFKPSEWVKVPTTTVEGTRVPIFGALAGRYIPGPIWNEVRQTAGDNSQPWGKLLTMWKTSKTALSPTVHTNNIMSNVLMSDWHDVGAAHVLKSIRILLAASDRKGRGIIGRTGNALSRGGITDREAAREIVNRYLDSGGAIGTWAAEEITRNQMDPLLRALEEDLQTNGETNALKIGVFSAMQHMLMGRVPMAYEALAKSKPVKAAGTEARSMIDLYQTEDDIFRLATWLKAKEDGHSDKEAGKKARKSFMDYHINAPWIQALRGTVLPFVSFTYRAVPMILHTAARNPHKLLNLMLVAGALNALGVFLSGADEDDERKLLPDEKSGKVWGIVPKLMRMPWNDDHDSPVYMDVRRFVPVGDFFDTGQVHAAVPLLPALQAGGPLWTVAEVALNKSSFTGREITLATDTPAEKAVKTVDHLYKSMAPNILGLPGSYATKSVRDAIKGRTDAFGRERSVAQSVASSFGFKLASYPSDTLLTNLDTSTFIKDRELKRQIRNLERQRDTKRISGKEFDKELAKLQGKREKLGKDRQAKRGY